jgi:acyl homoserine lactone synthase
MSWIIKTHDFEFHYLQRSPGKRELLMSLQSDTAVVHDVGQRAIINPFYLSSGELVVNNLLTDEDKLQAYRLRNRIFLHELGWALQSHDGLEVDEYDKHAVFFGVKNKQGQLLAFVRLILADHAFMIEKEFLSLVGTYHSIRKENDTVEMSRLCVAPESRKSRIAGNFGMGYISMLLFSGVYRWCLKHQKRYTYAVTEFKVYKSLCFRGFPCKLIGAPSIMPDGVHAVAFRIDLTELGSMGSAENPSRLTGFL